MEILNSAMQWTTTSLKNEAVRHILAIVLIGLPLLYIVSRVARKLTAKRFSAQASMVLQKGVFYIGLFALCMSVLAELDYNLTTLLGAAGIFAVAIVLFFSFERLLHRFEPKSGGPESPGTEAVARAAKPA